MKYAKRLSRVRGNSNTIVQLLPEGLLSNYTLNFTQVVLFIAIVTVDSGHILQRCSHLRNANPLFSRGSLNL